LASREKKPLSEKDRRKSQKFLLAFSRLSIVQKSFSFEKRLEKKPLLSSRSLLSVSLYGVF
jgi:hypothetical protein